MQIKQNAIFIADSHYNYKRETLYELLSNIDKELIECSQLFLMGDIFDFLSDEVTYFRTKNQEMIELIQKLSLKIETYYLEGNHDFNLEAIFKDATVIPRQEQPYEMKTDTKSVEIAHGDIFVSDAYETFCKIIRDRYFLSFLNALDISGWISKIVEKKLASKSICHRIGDFKYIVQQRIDRYKADIVLEGHYHEGKSYTFGKRKYINIPSLACGNQYIRYKDEDFIWEKI